MPKMSPLIQPKELAKLDPEDYILFDASAGSKRRYNENHLAGAFYIDLDTELANIKDFAKGGRHPLPSSGEFANTLGNFGVQPDTHVIIYDDKSGANAAARFWWMLKAIGHEKVQVVNGGFTAAVQAGFPTDDLVPKRNTKHYPMNNYQLPTADINEVETASKTGDQKIIDVRDKNRFDGIAEPIDLVAGHIPKALNIPFTENLGGDGLFLPAETLNEKYSKQLAGADLKDVIVHCGSGVTACHTLLAMDYANLPIPKLYVGSWSEWSRNGKEMITKGAQGD